MAERASHPLTPEEAKARLRAAAQQATPAYWVRQRPWQTLLIALCGGFLAGRLRLSPTLAITLSQRLLPLFVAHVLGLRP